MVQKMISILFFTSTIYYTSDIQKGACVDGNEYYGMHLLGRLVLHLFLEKYFVSQSLN